MTIQELSDKFSKFTGIRKDIGALIEGASTNDEKKKVYDHLMWHLRRGRILERPWDKELFEAIVPALQEKLNIESSVVEEIEEKEVYTAEEAAAYNLTLDGALQYGATKTPAVEAVEAQNAVYAFESYDSEEKTTKYGEGTVEVTELRQDGATVKVLTNTDLGNSGVDFVGQSFNVNSLDETAVLQLFSTQGLAQPIWVTVEKQSDAVEAVEAQDAVPYTNEEVDAYNAQLTGAKKAGDEK